ncbi:hypothetical protein PAXINDRAFT_14879 [Paxillus involutus ATCC 200175]|uniref:Unplaced genomic scaffold PAXINscaffold_44, whole genome shotgun sequence n=1 Tax=Paxillus involutus ATCC 200175 TaxID=664439 RepID=A0A0C9TYA5_PAXIN|nr:hypothetical protein PAXINDRAFT_14879 [Paxillus involutus ATCC 200175]
MVGRSNKILEWTHSSRHNLSTVKAEHAFPVSAYLFNRYARKARIRYHGSALQRPTEARTVIKYIVETTPIEDAGEVDATNSPSPDTSNIPSATASALFNLNYGTVSILVIWVYEYAITFDEEITFLRDSRWSIVKILYLVCRYLMFPFVITNTFHYLQRGLGLEECTSYSGFELFAAATIIFCAELMFLVRTYALWHRSRAALIIIIVNFTAFLIPIIVILALFISSDTIMPVSGITSCNDAVAQTRLIVWAYVLLVIGEAGTCKEPSLKTD